MSENVEILDISDSTSLSVALAEALGENVDVEDTENNDSTDESQPEDNQNDKEVEEQTDVVCEDESPELFFFENKDVTRSNTFDPEGDTDEDKSLPLQARGQIDNILLQGDKNTYRVFLRVDSDVVIDNERLSDLQSISQELVHIGAYQKTSGEHVLSVSDYPFKDELIMSISPTEETAFDIIRVEVMVDEFKGEK